MTKKKSNMYADSKKQWNVFVGCEFDCTYCRKSFQAQMKRQLHRCRLCYDYTPHFHQKRLFDSLPRTKGDEFIFCSASGDISFAKPSWITMILQRMIELPQKTFLLQSKNPLVFQIYEEMIPDNVLIGTTIESNRDYLVSKAPKVFDRVKAMRDLTPRLRKVITVEPIMDFDHDLFTIWIRSIKPERVYVGYDTKKSELEQPRLEKTEALIKRLSTFTKVKRKYIPEVLK